MNVVRDIIYSFCLRARLNAELEKAGVLQDDSIMVNLRRPADILVDGIGQSRDQGRQWERTALDVKVINALGQTHLQESMSDGLVVIQAGANRAFAYRRVVRCSKCLLSTACVHDPRWLRETRGGHLVEDRCCCSQMRECQRHGGEG